MTVLLASDSPINRNTVFVPGAYPKHSYVPRKFINRRTGKEFDPEEMISNILRQKGMIVQVIGPSKSGKTRAVENCIGIENLVSVAGSQISEHLDVWGNVCQILGLHVRFSDGTSSENKHGSSQKAGVEAGIIGAKFVGEINSLRERVKSVSTVREGAHDAFTLAYKTMIALNLVLFVDDFHTIPEKLRPLVAAQLKAAAQVGLKICLAEVPHHSHSTIAALPDLTGRITRVEFSTWERDDLAAIAVKGFDALGIELTEASRYAFSVEAIGSPQLMQLICLSAAESLGVDEPRNSKELVSINANQVREILIAVLGAVDREYIFNILDAGPDERGKPRTRYTAESLQQADNYEITLAAISLNPPFVKISIVELLKRIEQICTDPVKRPRREQITRSIEQLITLSAKHMPNLEIFEWTVDNSLHVLDPYFMFYLRWAEKYEAVRDVVRGDK